MGGGNNSRVPGPPDNGRYNQNNPNMQPQAGRRGGDIQRSQRTTTPSGLEMVAGAKSCQCYVGSLDYGIKDADLRKAFARFGDVVEANVLTERDNPGRSRGYGFVTYTHPEMALAAQAELNGTMLNGRRIKVGPSTATYFAPKGTISADQRAAQARNNQKGDYSNNSNSDNDAGNKNKGISAEAASAAAAEVHPSAGRSRSRSRSRSRDPPARSADN